MQYIAPLLLSALLWHIPATAMIAAEEVAERRQSVASFMGENAILVLFPEHARRRNNDVNWPYRQSSHLYYLTSHTLPGTHLILVKEHRKLHEYLFAKLSDPRYEVWEGALPTKAELTALTGVDTVYSADIFEKSLTSLLNGKPINPDKKLRLSTPEHSGLFGHLISREVEVWLDLGRHRQLQAPEHPSRAQQLAATLKAQFPEVIIRNISPKLEAMRRTKSDAELELLQRAIDITGEAQKAAMMRVQTASHEYQVQATIEHTFRDSGACCPAFPSIVANGANATILHYVENNAPLDREQLLLIDIGAEVDYYAADITRTFPVSGNFSEPQRRIYQLVLDAQSAAIAAAKRGKTMKELEQIAMRAMAPTLLEIGLISENNDEQIKSYFPHSLGHSLGLDTHDAFEYHLKLDTGMVVTIEPGLYVRGDDIKEKSWYAELTGEDKAKVNAALITYKGIGVRIEDVILITKGNASQLSADIPSSIEDIESFMAEAISNP